jgi:hypothetical protein
MSKFIFFLNHIRYFCKFCSNHFLKNLPNLEYKIILHFLNLKKSIAKKQLHFKGLGTQLSW